MSSKVMGTSMKSPRENLHLYDFLRAGRQVLVMKKASLETFKTTRQRIGNGLNAGLEYPWADLIALEPPKVFSDIVESVLGAIFIDTRGDLDACETFLENLGLMRLMRQMLDSKMEVMPPKQRLGIAAGNEKVSYKMTREGVQSRRVWRCAVSVGGQEIAFSDCNTKVEAESRAASKAIKIIQKRGLPP